MCAPNTHDDVSRMLRTRSWRTMGNLDLVGEAGRSELVAQLETMNRTHPVHEPSQLKRLRHWVIPEECAVRGKRE